MPETSIQKLSEYGQSAWLDSISRSMIESGKLNEMIVRGVLGITSNPSIFNAAISKSEDYDKKIIELKEAGKTTFEIYDELTVKDIADAADAFLGIYESTNKKDGYVSLEINPQLSDKVDESIKEGKRLFEKVGRPNLMIKVPATKEGYPVIEELISCGINVNATLIFSLQHYIDTAKAYIKGLTRLAETQDDLSGVHSVASVFVSRTDSAIDKILDEKINAEADDDIKSRMKSLQGKAAVSNCALVFNKFEEIFDSNDFKALLDKKANIQRVLWASTSTKSAEYSDIKYVTELISKPTVNTLPEKTFMAFLDHGEVGGDKFTLKEDAENVIKNLKAFDIDINSICANLLAAGVLSFEEAFESLFSAIKQKSEQLSLKELS
ncbi:MAG: transaldolase [Candidatus Zapsychrus exili]|nr:transaldolase [Candidatus Zapsychrus exili]